MEPFRKNDVVRLDIERFGSAGEGVAHLPGGMVVFVAGALPGETCQVQLLKVGKTAAWGRMQQVCAPSSARRAPDCGSYPRCGGCQFRHAAEGGRRPPAHWGRRSPRFRNFRGRFYSTLSQ